MTLGERQAGRMVPRGISMRKAISKLGLRAAWGLILVPEWGRNGAEDSGRQSVSRGQVNHFRCCDGVLLDGWGASDRNGKPILRAHGPDRDSPKAKPWQSGSSLDYALEFGAGLTRPGARRPAGPAAELVEGGAVRCATDKA